MERKPSMVAGMLTQVRSVRRLARESAIADLWKRNKLNPNASGYKIAETPMLRRDGREVVEYRLYKLIDASVTTISAEIIHSTEIGPNVAVEMKKS